MDVSRKLPRVELTLEGTLLTAIFIEQLVHLGNEFVNVQGTSNVNLICLSAKVLDLYLICLVGL